MNRFIKKGCYSFILSAAFMNCVYAADTAATPAPAAAPAAAPAVVPATVPAPAAPAPKFDCVLTDSVDSSGHPGAAKASFSGSTPMLYLICESDQVKKGQVVKTEWIADDTNNAAPNNYKIQEKSVDVSRDPAKGEVFTANFSLSKPDKGWPAGTYHAQVYIDNAPLQAVKFSVQ